MTRAVLAFAYKLRSAFEYLRGSGYFAEENWTCCQSCGLAELPEGTTKFVFYHQQDADGLIERDGLYLAWGGDAEEIMHALICHRLRVSWDGSPGSRIWVSLAHTNGARSMSSTSRLLRRAYRLTDADNAEIGAALMFIRAALMGQFPEVVFNARQGGLRKRAVAHRRWAKSCKLLDQLRYDLDRLWWHHYGQGTESRYYYLDDRPGRAIETELASEHMRRLMDRLSKVGDQISGRVPARIAALYIKMDRALYMLWSALEIAEQDGWRMPS